MEKLIRFRLLAVTIFIMFINNFALSNDNNISSIDVDGTQRIDIETVISYSNINIGDIYTEN